METARLTIRKLAITDFETVKELLQGPQILTVGWGKTYSDDEVNYWLRKVIFQYDTYDHSYFLVSITATQEVIGLVGLLPTRIENHEYVELAFLLKPDYQHHGYAKEMSEQLLQLAFTTLHKNEVVAQVVPKNLASKNLLRHLGFAKRFTYARLQNGVIRKHVVYGLKKASWL